MEVTFPSQGGQGGLRRNTGTGYRPEWKPVSKGQRAVHPGLQWQCIALADRDTVLILCSGLSQQPFTKRDSAGRQHFYRLRDPALRPIASRPVARLSRR